MKLTGWYQLALVGMKLRQEWDSPPAKRVVRQHEWRFLAGSGRKGSQVVMKVTGGLRLNSLSNIFYSYFFGNY